MDLSNNQVKPDNDVTPAKTLRFSMESSDCMRENHIELNSLETQDPSSSEMDSIMSGTTTERSSLITPPRQDEDGNSNSNDNQGPISSIRDYFHRLAAALSVKYLLFLGMNQVLICGVYASLIGSCFLPVFQKLGVDAATEQVLVLVCTLPYTASPLFGVISDLIPLAGYHKKYWMVLAIAVGALGSAGLGSVSTDNAAFVVLCMVFMNLQISVLNLLNEGKYSEIMRDHPDTAADIQSFQQCCAALGSLLAMSFVGPLSDGGHLKVLFRIGLALCLAPLFPVLSDWLPERRRSPAAEGLLRCGCVAVDRDRLAKQGPTVRIALLVGIGGPLLAVGSAYLSRSLGLAAVSLLLILVSLLAYATLPPVIASVVAYTIVTRASSPSLYSALQYFYTASPTCLPDGPHFSYTYYLTYNGLVGEVFTLVAILIYQAYMSQWSYRSVLLTTLLLSCGGRLVDVVLVLRWNATVLGIPDSLFFLLGSSMLESVTSMLHLMPFGAIVGKVCPPGTETATFAFVAGVSGFASTFASLAGSALMDVAGLRTTGEHCNFASLPFLIVGLSIVLPIAVQVPAIYGLIPNVLQSEPLTEEEWAPVDDEEGDEETSGGEEDDQETGTAPPIC